MKRLIAAVFLLSVVFGGSAAFSKTARPDLNKEVFYQIIIRSFYDSNGDGVGDIKGLDMKLDYLQELGVTTIWVTPIFASHVYHNYFADDFYKVDPSLGTLEDFRTLCRDVHKRGMKLLLDMETQYISKEHPWFTKAIADPKSEYNDYIAWTDREEEIPLAAINGFAEAVGYNGTTIGIMTLNMNSRKLLEAEKKIYAYWLDPNADGDFSDGVDGYRMDHMMDDLDNKHLFTGILSGFWRPIVEYTKKIKPDIVYIAEPADWGAQWDAILDESGFDGAFNIPQRGAILGMARDKLADEMKLVDDRAGEKYSLTIIENHDVNRFASEADSGSLKMGAFLNVALPGAPCLYYGQELGMKGERLDGQTDGNDIPLREAFRWYRDWTKKGMAVWYKVDKKPEKAFLTDEFWVDANVKVNDGTTLEEQKGNAASLWSYYKKVIALRKDNAALQTGASEMIDAGDEEVLSYVRSEKGASPVCVIANLSSKKKEIVLDLKKSEMKGSAFTDLVGGKKVEAADLSKVKLTLAPYQGMLLK